MSKLYIKDSLVAFKSPPYPNFSLAGQSDCTLIRFAKNVLLAASCIEFNSSEEEEKLLSLVTLECIDSPMISDISGFFFRPSISIYR